jgi:hypothetical protein
VKVSVLHRAQSFETNRLVGYYSGSYSTIVNLLERCRGNRKSDKHSRLEPKEVFKWLGPPNLQLGLSSAQFEAGFFKQRHETFAAAFAGVLLQIGLIAIATITVTNARIRQAVHFDIKNYGYLCYVIGSIMLSIGVGLCSFLVERNTVECDWKLKVPSRGGGKTGHKTALAERQSISTLEATIAAADSRVVGSFKQDSAPRLLWLQKSQELNDQAFNGYCILAGPQRHVVTSSRIEDTQFLLHPKRSPTPRDETDIKHNLNFVSQLQLHQ